jgi:hypothetical protein
MLRRSRRPARYTAPFVALTLALACQATSGIDPLGTAPLAALTAALPTGAVEAVDQQEAGPTPGTVRLTVRVVTKDTAIAAYQGVLTFTAGAFELVSVATPKGLDGEAHLINSTEIGAGRLPFAAYAPERFRTDEAFSLVVRPTLPLDAMHLSAALDVAGVASGRALATTSLRRSAGVRDASGRMLTTVR